MKTGSLLAFSALGIFVAACSGVSQLGGGEGGGAGMDPGSGGSNGQSGSGNSGGSMGYEPCANKPCGATCSGCAPGDMDCAEPAVERYCDQQGGCGLAYPLCDDPGACVSDSDCGMGDPAPCQVCPDNTYACPRTYCEAGRCVGSFPGCGGVGCTSDMDCPTVGAPCQICPDGTVSCPGSQCIDGMCAGGFPGCGGYDPCAGLACGDYCSPCPPDDPMCAAVTVLMYCNADGSCGTSAPECSPPSGCMTQDDCPQVDSCVRCAPDTCAELDCIQNECVFTCPPTVAPECNSAMDCVMDLSCQICADGTCAQTDCINGQCERVCGSM